MRYEETINISKEEFEKVNRLLEIPSLEEMTDKELMAAGANTNVHKNIYYVKFADGCAITYDLCSGNSNYWDDIIFSSELGDSMVDCTFELDDLEIEDEGNTYVVHINIEGE